LSAVCRACAAPLAPGLRFCTECGTSVEAVAAAPEVAAPATAGPETERRLCSVLFVDLVGFTPFSEGRDPEEVRELLTQYFDLARQVVARYGGLIEKFIGDAVMAVWGTPVAVEGDAERAVRAAMELVSEVAELGERVGATGLAARAGVVTGTVAATLAATGQAMVAGDAVNTAARVQSAATGGSVLVDTTTRRLAGLAIEFDLHGEVDLKGKTEPETLWRAREIVSGIGGAQRSDGLEAPFVGRTVELGLLKDVLHATGAQRRPRLVLVSGPAGVGKTRLGWELEKYVDGLAETVYWHRGRCPTFGEDTAFWALTEIVRARLGVAEDDDRSQIEDKLAGTLANFFDTETDREFVAVRLARLLGLPSTGSELPRAELFAGWRRFFEGLARRQTVLLLVEDLHDADEGLLDFLEHLVDWVRDLPVLVIGFARSELVERRPGLGTGRNRTLVTLSPLAEPDMHALLAGLVAHLPLGAAAAIEAQAEGIPLFAVETVRSLIDQDVVVASPEGYSLVGDLGELTVPDSLHALLAARLDALDPLARSLAAAAAVIDGPFTADTLVAVAALEPDLVHAGLNELTHRDVLQVSADALSPQLGSYSFTHGLLAQVAYQTLSHRDLKDRHLRIATHLAASARNENDALAEVVARHYLEALDARPNDDDVGMLRGAATDWLVRAADRAGSTGAQGTASRLFASAAELVDDAEERGALESADLWMRSAVAAYDNGGFDTALRATERAAELRARQGRPRLVALSNALHGRTLSRLGRGDEARVQLTDAVAILTDEPGPDTVLAMSQLASVYAISGLEESGDIIDRALQLAQRLGVDDSLLANLFNSRGIALGARGRQREAIAHYRESLRLAQASGSMVEAIGPLSNLGDSIMCDDPRQGLEYALRGEDQARQIGARYFLGVSLLNEVLCLLRIGEWDRAATSIDVAIDDDDLGALVDVARAAAVVWALRGDPVRAREIVPVEEGDGLLDPQDVAYHAYAHAVVCGAEGDAVTALSHARRAAEVLPVPTMDPFVLAWPLAARLAHELGDRAALDSVLALLDGYYPGEIPAMVRAECRLAEARLVADPVERVTGIEGAVTDLRTVGSPYHVALALLDLAEAQRDAGKDPSDVIAEAATIGATLGSPQVVERAEALRPRPPGDARTAP
jgi:class 3 adenylate cyclase/tetratricopeptide (TPR) repeat protein